MGFVRRVSAHVYRRHVQRSVEEILMYGCAIGTKR